MPLAAHSLARMLGQARQAALARRVGRHADSALEGQQAGDVDHLAGHAVHRTLLQRLLGEGLGQEEDDLQVGVHHRVPIGLGELDAVGAADDAGVVDQDVDLAEGGDGLVDHALDRFDRAEVGLDRQELATRGFDQGLGFGRRAAAGGGDVGAGLGQRHGHGLSKTGVGAGDEGDLAFETERIGHGACFLIKILSSRTAWKADPGPPRTHALVAVPALGFPTAGMTAAGKRSGPRPYFSWQMSSTFMSV